VKDGVLLFHRPKQGELPTHKTQYTNLKDRLGLLYEIILRLPACRSASALKLPIYEHLHGSDKVIRYPKPQALQPLLSSGMEL
jgi:hypothetical protein